MNRERVQPPQWLAEGQESPFLALFCLTVFGRGVILDYDRASGAYRSDRPRRHSVRTAIFREGQVICHGNLKTKEETRSHS